MAVKPEEQELPPSLAEVKDKRAKPRPRCTHSGTVLTAQFVLSDENDNRLKDGLKQITTSIDAFSAEAFQKAFEDMCFEREKMIREA